MPRVAETGDRTSDPSKYLKFMTGFQLLSSPIFSRIIDLEQGKKHSQGCKTCWEYGWYPIAVLAGIEYATRIVGTVLRSLVVNETKEP